MKLSVYVGLYFVQDSCELLDAM